MPRWRLSQFTKHNKLHNRTIPTNYYNYYSTNMKLKCRFCDENHLSIRCPQRSPEAKPRSWKDQVASFDADQDKKPFKCDIKLQPNKPPSLVCCDEISEFWKDIRVHYNQSIYRDFAGIRLKGTGTLIPPDHELIQPGHYELVSRTHSWNDEELVQVLQEGVDELKSQRPLDPEAVMKLEAELLLNYNYFSLKHEGNELSLDETAKVTRLLAGKDWKHATEHEELRNEANSISDSTNDVQEAINHIMVSQELPEYAKTGLTQEGILHLHSKIMHNLLHEEEEGLPGEYRKVFIGVQGSEKGRPNHADVPLLMNKWFMESLVQHDGENLMDYLARIHTEFQYIHPFRDGNGRMGRLIMNILLLKRGFPVLVLPTTLSMMFNHAIEMGHRGDRRLFARLISEALFSSLQSYEDAIDGAQLLPSTQDVFGQENMMASPKMVSP
jgi:hypothetical protein